MNGVLTQSVVLNCRSGSPFLCLVSLPERAPTSAKISRLREGFQQRSDSGYGDSNDASPRDQWNDACRQQVL